MKQSNLYGKLLVLLLLCTFASGCWGARETDEVAWWWRWVLTRGKQKRWK
ncbi:hypothetical protein [Desulforamulus profundi]|nr:hypothetical protein [Desulforamulus profundi]